MIRVGARIDNEHDALVGYAPNGGEHLIAHLRHSGVHQENHLFSHLDGNIRARPGDHVHVALHMQNLDLAIDGFPLGAPGPGVDAAMDLSLGCA